MRLTLRTLLAYLDDTLEPHEIKEIGQKAAESDAAQELVARIKQITRRRRLTTPPANGPGAKFDANTVAEYLDNELSSDLVSELEKTCLESDVHLAEVASCHQILTLVLGEPALVPPTARERMYGLVKGREAIPFRKAQVRAADDGENRDDDLFLGGLPSSRGWLIWALPLAIALLLAALAFTIWQTMPSERIAVAAAKQNPPPEPQPEKVVDPANNSKPVEPMPMPVEPTPAPVEPTPPTPDAPANPPSKVRVSVGRYAVPPQSGPSILATREPGKSAWQRLTAGAQVFTTDDLVSLPGYQSELDLGPDGGAHLLLHGHVPEYSAFVVMDLLMESAVQLHQPDAGFDMDLTLDRGRIYLSNHKAEGPVNVRLRFANQVWDLALLEPGTEIGVDLFKFYAGDIDYRAGEPPIQEAMWYLITGRAGIKFDAGEYGDLPAPAFIRWDNKGPRATDPQRVAPTALPGLTTAWNKTPPAGTSKADTDRIQLMRDALLSLSGIMSEKKAVDSALLEARQREDAPMLRILAIYSFGAVDAIDKLLDVLCNDDAEPHAADRNAAVLTLRRWLARDVDNGNRLFDAKKDAGLLMNYDKRTSDAQTALDFLHDFSKEDAANPATFDLLVLRLRSDQLAVRELAYWQLLHLSLGAKVALPAYNAGWSEDQRNAAADAWKALIGKDLPPPRAPRG